jgi:hypothetical protein
MRNKFLLMGIAVIALVLSITVIGCKEEPDSPDPALNGTWVNDNGSGYLQTYIFDDGSYENPMSTATYTGPYYKGSYSTDGDRLKWGKWQVYGGYFIALRNYYTSLGVALPPAMEYYSVFESRWYSSKEYENIMKEYVQQQTVTSDTTSVLTYAVYGDTLTLTYTTTKKSDGSVTTSSTTYTRRGGPSGGNPSPPQ